MTQNQEVNHEVMSNPAPQRISVEAGAKTITNKHMEENIMNQNDQLDPKTIQLLKDRGQLPPDFENDNQVKDDFFKGESKITKTLEVDNMDKQKIDQGKIQQDYPGNSIPGVNSSDEVEADVGNEAKLPNNNTKETETAVPEKSAQPVVHITGSDTPDNKDNFLRELDDILKRKAWDTALDKHKANMLINECHSENSVKFNKSREDHCINCYNVGSALNIVKSNFLKEGNKNWGKHAKENFPHIRKRMRQMMMKLAKFPGAEKHTRFGFTGLYTFVTELKGRKGEDPIGAFLSIFPIEDSDDQYLTVKEIEDHVKVAKIVEKASESEFDLKFENAKLLADNNINVDFAKVKSLLESTGGNLETYISNLIKNTSGKNGRKKESVSLKAMTSQLHSTVSNFIDEDRIEDDLKPEELEGLINDLSIYKELIEDEF